LIKTSSIKDSNTKKTFETPKTSSSIKTTNNNSSTPKITNNNNKSSEISSKSSQTSNTSHNSNFLSSSTKNNSSVPSIKNLQTSPPKPELQKSNTTGNLLLGKGLLNWAKKICSEYNVEVSNWSKSWQNGKNKNFLILFFYFIYPFIILKASLFVLLFIQNIPI
jgi:hypothetical protein